MKRQIITFMAFLCAMVLWGQTDVTSDYLTNADFTDGTNGWEFTQTTTSDKWAAPEQEPRVVEAYAGWGNLNMTEYTAKQAIILPAGFYRLEAYAFYRYGLTYDVDATKSLAYLYAGNNKKLVATLGSISTNSYANTKAQASNAFAEGNYLNTLDFYVGADNTSIEVGVKGTHELKQSWFILGPVKLYRVDSDGITEIQTFDMTGRITNPDFPGNSTGWSGTTPGFGSGVAEFYNKTFDMYQTLTGLPIGVYDVGCQGFYRMGGASDAATAHANGTEQLNAQLYANDASASLVSIFEAVRSDEKLADDDVQTSLGWVPNQMGGAAKYFANGDYNNKVEVKVTDGTLKIGLRKSASVGADWTIFDNFTLIYKGVDLDLLKESFNTLSSDLSTLSGQTDVQEMLSVFGGVAAKKSEVDGLINDVSEKITDGSVTKSDLDGAISSMTELKTLLGDIVPLYQEYNALLAVCEDVAENSETEDPETKSSFESVISDMKTKAAKTATTNDVNIILNALELARQTYVAVAEPINGHAFDLTFKVANADFASTSGWTGDLPTLGCGVAEFFDKTFDLSQTLTGLPNGLYKVSCQGYYRPGSNSEVPNHAEEMNVLLYAGEQSATLQSIMTDAGKDGQPTDASGSYTEAATIDGQLVPNSMAGAAKAFAAGLYLGNEVEVSVVDGTLTFGLKKTTGISNDWTIFDNFKLEKVRALDATEYGNVIEAWKNKAAALVDTKPLGTGENDALKSAVASAESISGKNSFELAHIVETLQAAVAAVDPWRTTYEDKKAPLVEAMERFERDYNDGANGSIYPMSARAWNTLLEAVATAAAAKDVTDSYDGFETAATALNAAMDATEPSIKLYAGYEQMMSALRTLDDTSLAEAVQNADTDDARATDETLRAAIGTMNDAFTVYRNQRDGNFDVSGFLGENLDFETQGDAVVGEYGTYKHVYDFPGWTNVYVGHPTSDNMQYMFREQNTDKPADVTTDHSVRIRAKWDTGETTLQMLKDAYLPGGEYTLSFYLKKTVSSAITKDLCYYEIGGKQTAITAGSEWAKQTIDISLDEPTAFSLSFGFVRSSDNSKDADIYVDDVTLVCHTQTAFARALAAAGEQAPVSLAAKAAYDEYKDAVEKDMAEDEKTEAVAVLNNAVKIAGNSDDATSLIKNADFTGGTDSKEVEGDKGQINTPKEWDFIYDFEGWNDTFVKTEEDGTAVFNLWAGIIKRGELMQTVNALPNGVYRLSADLMTYENSADGSSWVAIYGNPAEDYSGIGRADNVTCGETAAFDTYEVLFRVSHHAATVGVRSDALYFQMKNIRLEYVEDNDENAVKVDNGCLLQKAYVDRNEPVVDLTAFENASGVQVYLNSQNALIKALPGQVANEKNVIVDGVCENFELTDGNSFVASSEEFTATKATYTREMKNEWGTLILPYALSSDENVKYYQLTATREDFDGTSYMSFTAVEELPANTPCAFRRQGDNTEVVLTAENATVVPVNTTKVSAETELSGWLAEGYYANTKITDEGELAKTYYISNNQFMNATSSLTILSFRTTFVDSSTSGVNRFLIDFSDLSTSAVDAVDRAALSVFAERGMLRLVAGKTVHYAVYTVGGMLVEQGNMQAGEEHSVSLPAGIYIVNGLKVQVK